MLPDALAGPPAVSVGNTSLAVVAGSSADGRDDVVEIGGLSSPDGSPSAVVPVAVVTRLESGPATGPLQDTMNVIAAATVTARPIFAGFPRCMGDSEPCSNSARPLAAVTTGHREPCGRPPWSWPRGAVNVFGVAGVDTGRQQRHDDPCRWRRGVQHGREDGGIAFSANIPNTRSSFDFGPDAAPAWPRATHWTGVSAQRQAVAIPVPRCPGEWPGAQTAIGRQSSHRGRRCRRRRSTVDERG